jgi:hypothetical protein
MFRRPNAARVMIHDPPRETRVPETGAVGSVQSAEIELPKEAFDRLWRPENLERLARAYWRHLNRISLGLLRVVYSPTARTVVFLIRPLNLLRFAAPRTKLALKGRASHGRSTAACSSPRRGRARGCCGSQSKGAPEEGRGGRGSRSQPRSGTSTRGFEGSDGSRGWAPGSTAKRSYGSTSW